ncbi:HigA family addiction module antitoxin [bacterium]|nr:HigA family addiction module antitoxin [bacterium]
MDAVVDQNQGILSPPGDTLMEHIDFLGMSQAELAECMGRPKEKINDIVKGREPISIATAVQLELVLGIPAGFWINRERVYRQALYKRHLQEVYRGHEAWLRLFPVQIMQDRGWMPKASTVEAQVEDLLKFFGVASPAAWKRKYLEAERAAGGRISLALTSNPESLSVWLRQGERQTLDQPIDPFDKNGFRRLVSTFQKRCDTTPCEVAQLQSTCAKQGVALVLTPNLPDAPITAATRWFLQRPLIQLSESFQNSAHFRLVFAQHSAHLLSLGKKNFFSEGLDGILPNADNREEALTSDTDLP